MSQVKRFQNVSPEYRDPVNRVAVLGSGLVGGSIARSARSAGCRVVLYDADETVREQAALEGFLVADSPGEACVDAEVVFLAVPVEEVATLAPMIRGSINEDSIVTDVCSVKRPVQGLRGLLGSTGARVILGHPMAGSHQSGFAASRADLFSGCTWLLCDAGSGEEARRLAALIERLGAARIVDCPVEVHDTVVAVVSHLPQVAASVLAASIGHFEETLANGALEAAGGGFRDSTRLAESPYALWEPLMRTTSPVLAMLLEDLSARIIAVAAALRNDDMGVVEKMFLDGGSCRALWRVAQPVGVNSVREDAVESARWLDSVTGHSAWLDKSLAWETVRTSAQKPGEHAETTARYLAAALGVEPGTGVFALTGTHASSVASYLTGLGVAVTARETWTADGLHVEGVDLPDGRFIVVI